MAVRQRIAAGSQHVEVRPVEQVAPRQIAIARPRAAAGGDVEVLRQGIGFIPGKGGIGLWPCRLIGRIVTVERALGQPRQNGVGDRVDHRQGLRVMGEGVSIQQAHQGLVVGIGRQRIAVVEFRRDGRGETGQQAAHLGLGANIAADGIGARQGRDVLSEAVPRDEAGEMLRRIEQRVEIVPAAETPGADRHPCRLAERPQQGVFVEGEQRFKRLVELGFDRPVEDGDLAIAQLLQRRCGGNRRRPGKGAPGGQPGQRRGTRNESPAPHPRLPPIIIICRTITPVDAKSNLSLDFGF